MENSTRYLLIKRCNEIKTTEQEFGHNFWKDNFVSYYDPVQEKEVTVHLSEVEFEMVPDKTLIEFFEYLVRNQELRMRRYIL